MMEFMYGSLFGFLFGGGLVYAFISGRESAIRGVILDDTKEMEEILTKFRDEVRSNRDDYELVRIAISKGERLLDVKAKRGSSDG